MESLKCDACSKSFTGMVCFQQHEASEKHKKKVQQMNGLSFEMPQPVKPPDSMHQIHCSICKVSISGLENYQKHVNSLDHAIMVQKQNNDLLSLSVSNTFELKTEQNQLMESTVSLTAPTKAVAPFAECKPCQKQFSGPEPYQQHLASAGHRKKCGPSTQIMQIDGTDSIVSKDNVNLPCAPLSSVSISNFSETVPECFAKCDLCEMQFNGALPYQIHIVSDGHKMKASNQFVGNSLAESQSGFKCNICVMTFTGPVPYQQHLVSNGHKKKIISADLSKKMAATGSLSLPDSTLKDTNIGHQQSSINDLSKWYCDTCKKQCSGPIPYNTHLAGREHSKNLRILIVEENMKKIKVSSPHPYIENSEIDCNDVTSTINLHTGSKTGVEESSIYCKINNLNINIKSDDTKILSDKFQMDSNDLIALPNLNIIPPEKLDVTVFQPDDEIVFSDPKKFKKEFQSEIQEVTMVE